MGLREVEGGRRKASNTHCDIGKLWETHADIMVRYQGGKERHAQASMGSRQSKLRPAPCLTVSVSFRVPA